MMMMNGAGLRNENKLLLKKNDFAIFFDRPYH